MLPVSLESQLEEEWWLGELVLWFEWRANFGEGRGESGNKLKSSMRKHLYLFFSGILKPQITNVSSLYLQWTQLFSKFALSLLLKLRLVAVMCYIVTFNYKCSNILLFEKTRLRLSQERIENGLFKSPDSHMKNKRKLGCPLYTRVAFVWWTFRWIIIWKYP